MLVAHFGWDRSVTDGFLGIGRLVKLITERAVNLAPPIRLFEKTERERLATIETPTRGFAPEAAERESVSQIGTSGLERHDHSQFHAAQPSPPSRETDSTIPQDDDRDGNHAVFSQPSFWEFGFRAISFLTPRGAAD